MVQTNGTSTSTSLTGGFVRVAARAGEAGLLLGLRAQRRHGSASVKGKERANATSQTQGQSQTQSQIIIDDVYVESLAREVVEECRAMPAKGVAVLSAVGKVLEAVSSSEIVKAKYVSPFPLPCFSLALLIHLY